MNQLASLLVGMSTQGTNAAAGLQPGSAQTTGGTDVSAFQSLLMESLGETTQQVSNPASWAGQQLGGVEGADPESKDESADTTNLLGSTSMASSLIGAAYVVPTVAVVEPSVVTASKPEAAPTNATTGVPVNTSPVATTVGRQDVSALLTPVNSADSESLPAMVSADQQSAAVNQTHAQATTVAQNSEQTATGDAIAAQSSPDIAAVVEMVGVRVNETTPHATAAPAKAHHDGQKTHMQADQQTGEAESVPTAQTAQSDSSVQKSAEDAPSLPDVQAPMMAQAGADYQQMKLKLKVDARVAHDGDATLKEKLSLQISAASPEKAGQSVNSEKKPISIGLSTAELTADLTKAISAPTVAVAIEATTNQKSQGAKGDTGLAIGASGIQPSIERSVEGAIRSEGFNAPERVIEQKVIHQFVQAAKIQMTDGGANMTLRLDPPHLGVIHMNVSAQQGSVVASIQTSTEAARHALQSDLTSLRQSLADAGIAVDSINVSLANTPDQPGAQHANAHGDRRGHASHRNGASFKDILDGGAEPVQAANRTIRTAGGFDHLA